MRRHQFQANARKIQAPALARPQLPFATCSTERGCRQSLGRGGRNLEPHIMHTLRRRSSRRHCFRAAKIQLGAWTRDCLVMDISDGGVRLNAKGLDVSDEFLLLLSTDGVVRESMCQVAWRYGDEVGAKFAAAARRPHFAEPEKHFA